MERSHLYCMLLAFALSLPATLWAQAPPQPASPKMDWSLEDELEEREEDKPGAQPKSSQEQAPSTNEDKSEELAAPRASGSKGNDDSRSSLQVLSPQPGARVTPPIVVEGRAPVHSRIRVRRGNKAQEVFANAQGRWKMRLRGDLDPGELELQLELLDAHYKVRQRKTLALTITAAQREGATIERELERKAQADTPPPTVEIDPWQGTTPSRSPPPVHTAPTEIMVGAQLLTGILGWLGGALLGVGWGALIGAAGADSHEISKVMSAEEYVGYTASIGGLAGGFTGSMMAIYYTGNRLGGRGRLRNTLGGTLMLGLLGTSTAWVVINAQENTRLSISAIATSQLLAVAGGILGYHFRPFPANKARSSLDLNLQLAPTVQGAVFGLSGRF